MLNYWERWRDYIDTYSHTLMTTALLFSGIGIVRACSCLDASTMNQFSRTLTKNLHMTSTIGSSLKKYLFFTCLLYLIDHNNPINGFRPAATHPSRCLCFLRACANWLHQSMPGLHRFGNSNGSKVAFFVDFRRSPHQILVSPEHPG